MSSAHQEAQLQCLVAVGEGHGCRRQAGSRELGASVVPGASQVNSHHSFKFIPGKLNIAPCSVSMPLFAQNLPQWNIV